MQKTTRGFTIVELLIVIVVIAILAAITIVAYNGISNRAKASAASAAAEQAAKKVALYAVTSGDTFPTSLAAAGVSDVNGTTYQYRADNAASPKTYCLTATANNVSFYINNTDHTTPTAGACLGQAADGGIATTNLITRPSFEGGFTAFNPGNSRGYVWKVSTTRPHSGSSSYEVVAPTTLDDGYSENMAIAQLPTGTYTFSIWVYLTSNGPTFQGRQIWLALRNGTGTALQNLTYDTSKLNQWQRVSGTTTVTSVTADVWIRFYGPTGGSTYFDDLLLTSGSDVYPYKDGGSSGWIWNGTPNDSTSSGPAL